MGEAHQGLDIVEEHNNGRPLDEQRAIVGQARSSIGFLLTTLEELNEVFRAYDDAHLDDDDNLDDAALIPLGTTRADLRSAISSYDIVVMLLAQGHADNLRRFARGG